MQSSKPIKKGQVEDYISNSTQDALNLKADIGSETTNLSYTPSPTNGVVVNDKGTDANIPLADVTNAGLLSPADKANLDNQSGVNSGDETSIVGISGTKAQFNTELTDGNFLFVGDVLDTPDATVTTKGILKLTGDLGGTADNPTTPTAIHKIGDEIKHGILTLSDGLKIVGNTTSTTATKINVQENDGTINTISKSDLVNVVEVNDVSSLPLTGVAGKLYITKDNNKIYTWNGTFYSEFFGAKGEKGDQGPQGIQGVAGLTGLKGDKGDVGLTGLAGTNGLDGAKGDTGAKGDKGDQGIQGFKGDTGLTGADGAIGVQGPQGDQGLQGFKGDTGLTGADGAIGVQGPQGDQGLQGETGLRGIQGETGLQGPIGFTGEKGADGTGVSIKGSFDNTSQLPASGAAGDAYLINGNLHVWNGTAWINAGSIQGPQGLIGLTGATGSQGIQGVKGDKGDQGIQGIQGLKGDTGAKGDTGSFNGDITADQVTETATRKFQTPTQSAYNDANSPIQGQLNSKENTFSKNTAFNKNFGIAASTVAEGNDSRLSDSRNPLPNSSNYIQNQNASAQSANMWISGTGQFGDKVMFSELDPTIGGKIYGYKDSSINMYGGGLKFQTRYYDGTSYVFTDRLTIGSSGAATFSSKVSTVGYASVIESNGGFNAVSSNANLDNVSFKIMNSAASKVYAFTAGTQGVSHDGFGLWNVTDNTHPVWVEPSGDVSLNSNTTVSGTVTATSFNGSATLTGTPTAPTAPVGTNTTQIATTAFVVGGLATKANISGQIFTGAISATNISGTNTGDETTLSIQTKRPLKTLDGVSIEGVGDIITPTKAHALTHELGGTDVIQGENLSVNVIPPTNNYSPVTSTLKGHLQGIDQALGSVQSTLVSGTTVKTIEGQNILGSGNIDITKADVGLSLVPNTDFTAAVAANTAKTTNQTHTGDATGSTALTLATVNSNVGTFGNASNSTTQTVNAKGLTTAISNIPIQIAESQVTGLVSDLATKENAFSKNTAFNKNFGTTAGTVAEGNDSRFTDARNPLPNSSNYIQNQNGSAQSANLSISGVGTFGSKVGVGITGTGASPLDVQTSAGALGLNIRNRSSNDFSNIQFSQFDGTTYNAGIGWATNRLRFMVGGLGDAYDKLSLDITGAATFASTVTALGGNSTNWNTAFGWGNHAGLYLPSGGTAVNSTKWNGLDIALATYSSGNIPSALIYNSTNNRVEFGDLQTYKSWLGLGSNAYSSTAYLPLSGGTLSGKTGIALSSSGVNLNNSSFFINNTSNTKGGIFGYNDVDDSFYINIIEYGVAAKTLKVDASQVNFSNSITATSFNGSATLTGTPTAPTAAAGTNTTQIATTAFVQATRPYKVYTALLSQSGTNAPVATVLENTLGGTVVWTRGATGIYIATLSATFNVTKTFCLAGVGGGSLLTSKIFVVDGNSVYLATYNSSNSTIDYNANNLSIEIRVYN